MSPAKNIIALLAAVYSLSACTIKERFECPCGGEGKVVNGTVITIEEKNEGDTKAILEAVEKRLGGECCQLEDEFSFF